MADALPSGPESRHVVEAVDFLLGGDVARARAALIDGAEHVGWDAVAHRIDVAGRALAFDACTDFGDEGGAFRLVAEVNAWSDDATVDLVDVPQILDRWCEPPGPDAQSTPSHQVWTALALLSWLVERAGYPAQVVV